MYGNAFKVSMLIKMVHVYVLYYPINIPVQVQYVLLEVK